ncbi:hypothetical protein M8J76_006977 [Diaphorina citri]|nr:hypothetical protein M8J76_006977 [Diaphorina citri]
MEKKEEFRRRRRQRRKTRGKISRKSLEEREEEEKVDPKEKKEEAEEVNKAKEEEEEKAESAGAGGGGLANSPSLYLMYPTISSTVAISENEIFAPGLIRNSREQHFSRVVTNSLKRTSTVPTFLRKVALLLSDPTFFETSKILWIEANSCCFLAVSTFNCTASRSISSSMMIVASLHAISHPIHSYPIQ